MVKVQFVLTEDLHARLRRLAEERGKSMSALVREMLTRSLAEATEERRHARRKAMSVVARTIRSLAETEEQRRERRRRALSRLAEASQALEAAGLEPMSSEQVVALVRAMREERTDGLVGDLVGD